MLQVTAKDNSHQTFLISLCLQGEKKEEEKKKWKRNYVSETQLKYLRLFKKFNWRTKCPSLYLFTHLENFIMNILSGRYTC